jgi:four helix bundle protein
MFHARFRRRDEMELLIIAIPDLGPMGTQRETIKKMKDFRSLEVWKQSHQLVLSIYRHTESLPKSELFGLTSQIRRAATSIPTNIAEGCGRDGEAELGRFLIIAKDSTSEVEYLLQLTHDLNYIESEAHKNYPPKP